MDYPKFKDLKVGDNNLEILALVTDCKVKQTVNQTPYYGLTISDGDTLADARMWTVTKLITENADKFFNHPAAMTMHHNYINGLVYHTYSMLKIAEVCLVNYPALNKDLLFSGILIHDIGKTIEISDEKIPTYSMEGNLLGHIVIGLQMLHQAAKELNVLGTEEVLALEHLIAAHHGELEYGSPKEPLIMEAQLLFYIDLLDSKLAGINAEVAKTEAGSTTNPIPTLGRKSLYVPNILK